MKLNFATMIMLLLAFFYTSFAQTSTEYLNVFEPLKNNESVEGVKVKIGGSFALQFQAIDHQNRADFSDNGEGLNNNELIPMANNFNLATANLDLDVLLGRGLAVHVRTYLSSRHHHEPYVKGGYFQVDRLDFVKDGFLESLMDRVTLKIGHMENNYGDAHLRRSDNSAAFYNPFVENLLMDGFTTEVGGEFYYTDKKSGLLLMLGASNGKLNQDVKDPDKNGIAFLGKVGFDKTFAPGNRFRLTGSIYSIGKAERIYVYSADRTGSRYYSVMESITAQRDDFRSGRINPNFADKVTAIMVNPFVRFRNLEFFGTLERASGGDKSGVDETRTWNQLAGELLYRFGSDDRFYIGGRYNTVGGKLSNSDAAEVSVDRIQASAGWYLNQHILAKVEYVKQNYNDYPAGNIMHEGQFDGFVAEAVIGF